MESHLEPTVLRVYSWLIEHHVTYTNWEVEAYSLFLNLVLHAGGRLGGYDSLSVSSSEGNG